MPFRGRGGLGLSSMANSVTLTVRYFAILRDQRGLSEEVLETTASGPADLYSELRAKYGFSLRLDQVRFAVNGSYVDEEYLLKLGDSVVFIPPVAGG